MEEVGDYSIRNVIGAGSFGEVRECIKNNKIYAVKIVELDEKIGINNLLELSIMKSFKHTNLNNAIDIIIRDKKIYIFQDIASRDLYDLVHDKKSKLKHVKKILYSICLGLYELHRNNIIHCDIKLSNILYYPDGNIKISDFGECTKKWHPKFSFRHETGSPAYKSPEIFNSMKWDSSSDIWSLGCVFYEIYTGKKLFHSQARNNNENDTNSKNIRLSLFKLAQEDLHSFMINFNHRMSIADGYKPPTITKEILMDMDRRFLHLIIRMLNINPKKRPSCEDILLSDFFKSKLSRKSSIRKIHFHEIDVNIEQYLPNMILLNPYIKNTIITITKKIYCTCINLNIPMIDKILACYFISYKMIKGEHSVPGIGNEIVNLEVIICSNIDYKLLSL